MIEIIIESIRQALALVIDPIHLPVLLWSLGVGVFAGSVLATISYYDINRSQRVAAENRRKLAMRKAEHE